MLAVVARTTPDRHAPRIEARGIGAHCGPEDASHGAWLASDLGPGSHRLSEQLELTIQRTDHGHAATLQIEIANRGERPLHVGSIVVGFRWCGHGVSSHRFLRHGWQSWSYTGYGDLDDVGQREFPSGAWLRGMYHCLGTPAADRVGWHESETFAVVGAPGAGPCCLVGALETGRAFAIVHLRAGGTGPGVSERAVDLDIELRVEAALAPGERRPLEAVRVAVGDDANALLERYATLWGRFAGARTKAPFQSGWCSWYQFFHRINESDLLRNLDQLVAHRDEIPIDLVQLDDGYQRTIGDWLETNDKFPRGLAFVAEQIRAAGFSAGIWTVPFAASAESRLLTAHPDWALADGDRWLRGSFNREWSADGWVYALDPTRPAFVEHLVQTYRALVGMGFEYQKLDFLYMAAMQGLAADPTLTRAMRLRAGLEAIRRGAGPDAFLLGCGCPMGPAVGVVDGMRIGPDVAPSWRVDQPVVIPGLEPMLPSTASAIRSIVTRAFMHRRLWLNDPDCLMARSRETALRPEEARSLAAAIAVSGGMLVMSDDVGLLDGDERALVARVAELGRQIDSTEAGACRIIEPFATTSISRLESRVGPDVTRVDINLGDVPARSMTLSPGSSGGLVSAVAELSAPDFVDASPDLAAHVSRVSQHRGGRALAVFCDFDGTFSQLDVGSTLARRHLPDRRKALWQRYEIGEIDAWQYAELLFDGFEYGPAALETFLAGIDLDPGARELVDWCGRHVVPLRILSDGFDHNLDRMQVIHGVRFEYTANRLRFDGDRWRISPGHRNPDCDCGTGTCKRSWIEAHRAAHPDRCIVHIGNGRVSDRCGAEAADIVFAKDSLALDLVARGVAHHPFVTLSDVVARLDADWGARSGT